MKLIIEIPEEVMKATKAHNLYPSQLDLICENVLNGTPIPDNATNGDVAELVWGFKPRENTCIIPKTECNGNPAECDGCRFDDWWNSPYQKGGKEYLGGELYEGEFEIR